MAHVGQADTQHCPGSRYTDPHLLGFRVLINRMGKFSGKAGDNNFEAWFDDLQSAATY